MHNALENFGCMVFDDRVMRERLPKDVYQALMKTIRDGRSLNPGIANVVANAMKDWAVAKGVTHYTHWFQPMTGITAEKHDSFLSPVQGGGILLEFSGKELIQGEPDASSFPSGGLRATFEARGYTAWDPTSYAFIKDNTLCIPTAFCSYSGEALDKKTPLLRSMERINKEALRLLRMIGREDITFVRTTVGAEQEYFLIDREVAAKRQDIAFCGRTLFGASPPKGQEMDDHYYGSIRPRVKEFMRELNDELWKLGVLAKTEHNEVAPSQHELAPVFTTTNIATDQNQLMMEMMKKVAERHGLLCLLHEKPFAGINGSGKHNNWSLTTNFGENLLDPGENPAENLQFLLLLTAVLQAVDDYQGLLRMAVANAGNDHRLGGNEAPPSIVSVFLGDALTSMLDAIEQGVPYDPKDPPMMRSGVHTQPRFKQDNTDRNRTSPFAFTGNKFEFRMLGSSFSIAGPNFILNTIVAESLQQYADALEGSQDVLKDAMALVRKTISTHKRIIFNGNNYSEEWVEEAARRGLLNLASTVDAMPCFIEKKNVDLFVRHQILTAAEIHSRYEIKMENYIKTVHIEAMTLLDMVRKDIIPAVHAHICALAQTAEQAKRLCPGLSCREEMDEAERMYALLTDVRNACRRIETSAAEAARIEGLIEKGRRYQDAVRPAMQSARTAIDALEQMVSREYWPYPTYAELLYSV